MAPRAGLPVIRAASSARCCHPESSTLASDEAGHVVFTATVKGETWSEQVSDFDAHAWKTATFYFKAGSYYTLAVKGCSATVSFQSLKLFFSRDQEATSARSKSASESNDPR